MIKQKKEEQAMTHFNYNTAGTGQRLLDEDLGRVLEQEQENENERYHYEVLLQENPPIVDLFGQPLEKPSTPDVEVGK